MLNKVSATTAKEQRPVPQCSPTIRYYSSLTNRMLKRLLAYKATGYVQCRVMHSTVGGDHELFVCEVKKQVVLKAGREVMTCKFLTAHKLLRG